MKKINQIIFISLLFVLSFGQAFGEEYWQCEKIDGRGFLFFNEESSCDISSHHPSQQCKTDTCEKINPGGLWICKNPLSNEVHFIGDVDGCNEVEKDFSRGCICKKVGEGDVVPVDLIPDSNEGGRVNGYKLLAPIGNLDFVSYDSDEDNFVGDYLAKLFKLAIGIIAVLAVIMLIVAGIQYMGEDSIFGKTKAKNQMTNAILGLLIALGSYAILYTISPDLIGDKGLFIEKISIDLPDSGDGTVDQNCKEGKEGSYLQGFPTSPEVTAAVKKIEEEGWGLDSFEVSSEDNKMSIILKKNGEQKEYKIGMSPGTEGYAQVGAGKIGDKKTPKGSWKIVSKEYNGNGLPVFSNSCSNMGASFWLLDPMINGESRGIGIHGNYSGLLGPTHGCIRLTNSDILALRPYVKVGMGVEIK